MYLWIPIDLMENDPFYDALSTKYIRLGKKREANNDETAVKASFGQIYQQYLPKIVSDNIEVQGVHCWIEIDASKLELAVPTTFHNSTKQVFNEETGEETTEPRLLKDYVMTNIIKDDKALIFVSYGQNGFRMGKTTNEEFYSFIREYGLEDLSNVYTEAAIIQAKRDEYAGIPEN